MKKQPIFKYIGGKTWLSLELQKQVEYVLSNKKITSYCEPFVGGLGSFIAVSDVLIKHSIETVVLNDINKHIVEFYKEVSNDYKNIFNSYVELEKCFMDKVPLEAIGLHQTKDKKDLKILLSDANNFFKEIREEFNKEKSLVNSNVLAKLLFLQKHSFNGIYRENLSGDYNAPFNWNNNPISLSFVESNFKIVQQLLNKFDIIFSNKDFSEVIKEKNSLYYLDPPYYNEKMQENNYNKNGFDLNKQKKLISLIQDKSFIYSNHYSQKLIDLFLCDKEIIKINRKNIISSKPESRQDDKEEMIVIKV